MYWKRQLWRCSAALIASLGVALCMLTVSPIHASAESVGCTPSSGSLLLTYVPANVNTAQTGPGANINLNNCTVYGVNAHPSQSAAVLFCSAAPFPLGLHPNGTVLNLQDSAGDRLPYTPANSGGRASTPGSLQMPGLIQYGVFTAINYTGNLSLVSSLSPIPVASLTIAASPLGAGVYPPAGTYTDTLVYPIQIFLNPQTGTTDCTASGNVFEGTSTVTLSASVMVPTYCAAATATDMAFGSYQGPTFPTAAATSTISVTCSSATAFAVTLGDGNNPTGPVASGGTRRMANGSNYLSYQIFSNSAMTTQWTSTAGVSGTGATGSATIPLTAYGLVPSQPAPNPGTYNDTVVTTVTY